MIFSIQSHLHYEVNGPGSILCSVRGRSSGRQQCLDESLVAEPDCSHSGFPAGNPPNTFDRFDPRDSGALSIHYEGRFESFPQRVPVGEKSKPLSFPDEPEAIPYLLPSRYAPADRFRHLATELFGGYSDPFHQALAIEDWLFDNLDYVYGSSTEQTWAPDTFDSRQGVCRDFAHLGITFCRALLLPARYVTAYGYGLDPQDFHAAFEVYIDGEWHLMDGTRLVPLNALAVIAIGRDAADTAVATVLGDIQSTGMEIYVHEDESSSEKFEPITRSDLKEAGESIILA